MLAKIRKVVKKLKDNPYLLAMLIALLLYTSSFLIGLFRSGEAEEVDIRDLPEAFVRAARYLVIYSEELEDIRIGGNYTTRIDPTEIDNNLELLLKLEKKIGGRKETSLETLLVEALDDYIRINNASSIGVKSLNITAEGYKASKLALDLLALCRVEEAIQAYQASQSTIKNSTYILAEIHSLLLLVEKEDLLSTDHRKIYGWAITNTSTLLEGLYWTNQLLLLATENPSVFKNACRVAREGGQLAYSDEKFISNILDSIDFGKISSISSSSSSAIKATLLKALKSTQQGSTTATAPLQSSEEGSGAGYKEVEEDD